MVCCLLPDGDARFSRYFTPFSCTLTGLCYRVIYTASAFRFSSASPNYIELHRRYSLDVAVGIAFWYGAPANRKQRLQLESERMHLTLANTSN